MVKIKSKRNVNKILLIDPEGFGSGLNLGIGYLAAVLTKNGYQVKVVDYNNDSTRLSFGPKINFWPTRRESWEQKITKALDWKPDVIGVSINSFSLDNAVNLINYCKSVTDNRTVYIAGGPHVTMFKKEFLEKHCHLFDFGIVGEGEETIIDLIKNIFDPQKVKGIIFWDSKNKEIIETETRPLITDLDNLPFPNFEVFDSVDKKKGLYNYQMISSRGCPYKCVFCNHLWSLKWRARTPENILEEIIAVKKKFGIKTITFWDDNFTLDIKRAKKICDMLIQKKLGISYYLAGIRADCVDEELIKKLKESGCLSVSIGIEDGDPKTFPFVSKGETLDQIEKTVKLVQKYKIPLLTYMVTGLINHTYKSFLTSLKFIEKLGVQAHWSIAFPFPNTKLYDWTKENGRFLMTLEEGFKRSMTNKDPAVVFDTKNYTKEERIRAYYLGNLRSKSYDMVVSSRDGSFFIMAFEIMQTILKYDSKRVWWHITNMLKILWKS